MSGKKIMGWAGIKIKIFILSLHAYEPILLNWYG